MAKLGRILIDERDQSEDILTDGKKLQISTELLTMSELRIIAQASKGRQPLELSILWRNGQETILRGVQKRKLRAVEFEITSQAQPSVARSKKEVDD